MGRALAVRVRELGLCGSLHQYDDINRIWIRRCDSYGKAGT